MTLDSADTAAQTVLTRLKADISGCDSGALRLLLTEARSHNGWLDRPVADSLLKELYEIMRWGPTSANSSPARVVLLKTAEAKARLEPALKPNNVEKTLAAPVTAIIAHDTAFWTNAEKLFPHNPAVQLAFKDNPAGAEITAFRNGTLQGAYFLIAARAVGLDCGPMSGFDNALVDEVFFAGTTLRSNFLCNLGYGDISKVMKRSPRLTFDEVCEIL